MVAEGQPEKRRRQNVEVRFGSQSSLAAQKRIRDNLFGCEQLMVSRSRDSEQPRSEDKGNNASQWPQ
jgi:hypothetical protein